MRACPSPVPDLGLPCVPDARSEISTRARGLGEWDRGRARGYETHRGYHRRSSRRPCTCNPTPWCPSRTASCEEGEGGRGWTSDFSPGVRAGAQISDLARADPRVGGRADARARRRVARDARKYYVGRRYSLRVRDRTGGDAERPPDAVRPHVRDGSLMVRVLRVVGGIDARRHHAGADDGVVADARGDHLRGVVEVVDCAEPRSRPVGVRVACATSTSFPSMETSQRPRTRKLPFLEFSFGVTWHILPRGVPGVETGVSPRRERWGSARRRSPRS